MSYYDQPNYSISDNARRSHRKKFNKTVDFYLKSMKLEERVAELKYKKVKQLIMK